ncbi:hypothetical protein LOZ39_001783 [Ophidiomyces ophidiicola]|nr:hypothetical protein LOZ49_002477 [Ophidiomyces ophidiicola]KAI2078266.1 hypothetical protein LOZ39_001783 [Ophidiomyces ophidiicola]KAI2145824.1 hypothetical protein LOZ29_000249 [Ophidiomyces ophidiicola]KAI2146668.1 hypothetical protein LOZ28_000585 [Ophidiomyces ophidiicola]KAI2225330.1 hypothetical protein LOZ15_000353 [Ophidiomyces ophidiicola]
MAKDRSDKEKRKEKKEKKRSEVDGVHKKSKKDKERKKTTITTDVAEKDLTDKVLAQLDTTEDVIMEAENQQKEERPVGSLVPFANPLADDKAAKKVLKSVKKAAVNKSLKRGVKEVVKAVRKSPMAAANVAVTTPIGIVVLAADISPMDVISHIPVLCEDHGIPYVYVTSRAELGNAGATKRPTSVVMVLPQSGGKKKKEESKDDAENKEEYSKEPNAILSKLPVLPGKPDLLRCVPILLATPAFASWTQPHGSQLPSVINHVFRNSLGTGRAVKDVFSISAIVDKLPASDETEQPRKSTPDKRVQAGSEGISVLLIDRDHLSADIVKPTRRRDISMHQVEPIITYVASTGENCTGLVSTEVGIYVANTVFITGVPRTMLASRWRSDGTDRLELEDAHDLAFCRIEPTTKSSKVAPFVPLHPVTEPRKVLASMGNVLSQISIGDGTAKSAPASAELEKALPLYINRHQLQNHRLAVWALVTPRGSKTETWTQNKCKVDSVSNSIRNGARLHRLMSGGGGWGKKQGLLSLDPEFSYQEDNGSGQPRRIYDLFEGGVQTEPSVDGLAFETPNLMEFSDGKLITPLSETAKPGDTVQFFVAPLDNGVPIHVPANSLHPVFTETGNYLFGVIPPADAECSPSTSFEENRQPPGFTPDCLAVLPNKFGALSEKGITFATVERGCASESKRHVQLSGTKIDVPGSRIILDIK